MAHLLPESEIKNYVINFIAQHNDPALYYHNQFHTESVVKAAKEMADHYQLSAEDHFIVSAAAWFHDIGYYDGKRSGHEKAGADLAAAFLQQKLVPAAIIEKVEKCILAT